MSTFYLKFCSNGVLSFATAGQFLHILFIRVHKPCLDHFFLWVLLFFPSSILEEGEVHTEVGELPEAASDVFEFLLAPLKRLC